MQTPISDNEH